jgi:hypothetical protein
MPQIGMRSIDLGHGVEPTDSVFFGQDRIGFQPSADVAIFALGWSQSQLRNCCGSALQIRLSDLNHFADISCALDSPA